MDGILSWLTSQQVQSTEDADIERVAEASEEGEESNKSASLDEIAVPEDDDVPSEVALKSWRHTRRLWRDAGVMRPLPPLRMLSSIEPSFAPPRAHQRFCREIPASALGCSTPSCCPSREACSRRPGWTTPPPPQSSTVCTPCFRMGGTGTT